MGKVTMITSAILYKLSLKALRNWVANRGRNRRCFKSAKEPVMRSPLLLPERATGAAAAGNSVVAWGAYRLGQMGSKPILEQSHLPGGNQEPCSRSEARRVGNDVSVRVELGGRRSIKKKTKIQ